MVMENELLTSMFQGDQRCREGPAMGDGHREFEKVWSEAWWQQASQYGIDC